MFITSQILSLLLLLASLLSAAIFSPNQDDYNVFGKKVAANDLMIVEAHNGFTDFLVQFAPYTDNATQTVGRTCSFEYDDPSQFVYAVALGRNQSSYHIFFVGETIDLDEEDPLVNRTFVGILSYTGPLTTIDCDNGFSYMIQHVQIAFAHQERLVMTTDPLGLVAYGFSNLFTFSYVAATNVLTVNRNNSLSPSTLFVPAAVDYDGNHGIVAGYISNGRNART